MKTICLLACCLISLSVALHGQRARIIFYNTENFFDNQDDTLVNDNEFMPDSSRFWTYDRFWKKVVRIYQVMSAADEWDMPVIAGFCEVENRGVLEKLVYETPLEKYNYRIIHKDSPDPRGIDVALIYRKDVFRPDTSEWINVPVGEGLATREILKVTGRLWEEGQVTIYINHWPSRSGGALSSEPKRIMAASVLKASLDALFAEEPGANVIIMGDFNDEPMDVSLKSLGKTGYNPDSVCQTAIINLSEPHEMANQSGTIKYGGVWSIFDQVLVSCSLINGKNGLKIAGDKAEIFAAPFLLEPDPSYSGMRPRRTYLGPNYHDGFSDHLPVSVVVEEHY